jgi:hypothetical protein
MAYFAEKEQTMEITITKSNIVEKAKAYVGVFARSATDENGNSLYDLLRIEDRDDEVVQLMYNDAVGIVLEAMGDYVSSKSDGKLEISQPPRSNDCLFADVGNMVELALVNRIAALWMELKYPQKAEQFNQSVKSAMEGARNKMFTKEQPKRKTFGKVSE